ncbi:MAG: response regulator [Deltaproteobacteria bacterium]|nr:response regulator [Deltaproteobacteria bacterium]
MPRQILLADDSITIQKVIALTFAGEDYKITAVDNGSDAIVKAMEIRPDIILADVVMPQKNGYEVCEAIKNDPQLKAIPVLLLAGTFEPFDEDLAKKAGADGYIIKPFESQALIQKVKELISARPAMPSAAEARVVTPAAPIAPPKPFAPAPVAVTAAPPVVQPIPAPAVIPVISAPPKPPAPPVAVPAPTVEEDFWGTMMEEAVEKGAPKEVAPAESAEEEVPAEDVWEMGESEEAAPAAEAGEEELWDSFAFEEAEEKEVEEVMEAPLIEEAASVEEELGFAAEEIPLGGELAPAEEVPEEEFIFETEEEEVAEVAPVEEVSEFELEEVSLEPAEEPLEIVTEESIAAPEEFTFEEEVPVAPVVPEVQIEPQPEIVQGYEQTFEPEAFSREVSAAPPTPEPIPSPPSAPASMSEEQLRVALSQVSREVIEKIVWEVVPDLAEMLIKEEIKRLQKKQ